MKCYGCGVEKDPEVEEVYSYPEDGRLSEESISPLLVLECNGGVFGTASSSWRAVVICHHCFRKLDVDMWISENCWRALDPKVPYSHLPNLIKSHRTGEPYDQDPTHYPDLLRDKP